MKKQSIFAYESVYYMPIQLNYIQKSTKTGI